jgi:hypothetical protein
VEFQFRNIRLERLQVILDGIERILVTLIGRHFQQFAGILQALRHVAERHHDFFEARAFAAQFLGPFRIVPDRRVFQFATDFGQPFSAGIEVKDTP